MKTSPERATASEFEVYVRCEPGKVKIRVQAAGLYVASQGFILAGSFSGSSPDPQQPGRPTFRPAAGSRVSDDCREV
jgi:hypothetical protein